MRVIERFLEELATFPWYIQLAIVGIFMGLILLFLTFLPYVLGLGAMIALVVVILWFLRRA